VRAVRSFGLLAVSLFVLTACDDSTGIRGPLLIADSVTVAAPLPQNAEQPQALDITSSFGIRGGRFPERASDALQWDFAVRIQDGEIVLVPAGVLGIDLSNPPAITPAIEGETLESLREAPGQSTFLRDRAIPMREGAVYAARSREFLLPNPAIGGALPCTQFAKLEPVEVDVQAGLLRLYIVTNENCGDLRLAPTE
jgi:hypothetical protein